MKSLLTAFFTLLISTTLCNAQTSDKPKVNAISLELGKTGLIYNIVFDHRFKDKNFGIRVNIGSNFSRYLSLLTTGAGVTIW